MKQVSLLSCLFLLNIACVKRSQNCCVMPAPEMVRTQSQCADPWGYGNTDPETIDRLKHYLTQKNISFSTVHLQSTGEYNTCAACTCSKGFAFHVWTEPRFIDSLTKEGFVLK